MPLEAASRAYIAYSRFGLGCGLAGIESHGDDAYIRLLQEIAEGDALQPGVGTLPTASEIYSEVRQYKEAKKAATSESPPKNPVKGRFLAEIDARYNGTMLDADTGLTERLVMFWANHFAISRDKNMEINAAAGAFEREAIRPFVYGRFVDMLLAVETHPCMVQFLDNQSSTGPNSSRGRSKAVGLERFPLILDHSRNW